MLVNKGRLHDAILRLGKSSSFYINMTNRKAKPLLILVMPREMTAREFEELNEFTRTTLLGFKGVPILTVDFDEFNILTLERIIELMNYDKYD